MGPHWPGHSPPRKTTERSPGVSPGPAECGVEPKSDDRLNPMGGVPRLQAEEKVKGDRSTDMSPYKNSCHRSEGLTRPKPPALLD
jgi:hypothetical protein